MSKAHCNNTDINKTKNSDTEIISDPINEQLIENSYYTTHLKH